MEGDLDESGGTTLRGFLPSRHICARYGESLLSRVGGAGPPGRFERGGRVDLYSCSVQRNIAAEQSWIFRIWIFRENKVNLSRTETETEKKQNRNEVSSLSLFR